MPFIMGALMIVICVAMNLFGTSFVGRESIVFVLALLAPFGILVWYGFSSANLGAAPTTLAKPDLLKLPQAEKYAKTFGGGHVLITSIWQFLWTELDTTTGVLRERGVVDVVGDPAKLASASPKALAGAAEKLVALISMSTAARSTITGGDRLATLLAYHARTMVVAVQDAG